MQRQQEGNGGAKASSLPKEGLLPAGSGRKATAHLATAADLGMVEAQFPSITSSMQDDMLQCSTLDVSQSGIFVTGLHLSFQKLLRRLWEKMVVDLDVEQAIV